MLSLLAAMAILAALITSATGAFTQQVVQGHSVAYDTLRAPEELVADELIDDAKYATLLATYPIDATRIVRERQMYLQQEKDWPRMWTTYVDAKQRGVPDLAGEIQPRAIKGLVEDGRLEEADRQLSMVDFDALPPMLRKKANLYIARIHLREQDLGRRYQ